MTDYLPLDLFNQGFGSSLISVIPPGAQLAPSSKISASGLGKSPGIRVGGLWRGYDWQKRLHTAEEVKLWQQQNASRCSSSSLLTSAWGWRPSASVNHRSGC